MYTTTVFPPQKKLLEPGIHAVPDILVPKINALTVKYWWNRTYRIAHTSTYLESYRGFTHLGELDNDLITETGQINRQLDDLR